MSRPRVVTVGNIADYPPSTWGSKDPKAALDLLTQSPAREFLPLPGPTTDVTAFQIDPPGRPGRDARGRSIDALLLQVLGRR